MLAAVLVSGVVGLAPANGQEAAGSAKGVPDQALVNTCNALKLQASETYNTNEARSKNGGLQSIERARKTYLAPDTVDLCRTHGVEVLPQPYTATVKMCETLKALDPKIARQQFGAKWADVAQKCGAVNMALGQQPGTPPSEPVQYAERAVTPAARTTQISAPVAATTAQAPLRQSSRPPDCRRLGMHYRGSKQGIRVLSVEPGCAADEAGFRVRDVITSFGGVQVGKQSAFGRLVASAPEGGAPIPVRIMRGKSSMALTVRLSDTPGKPADARMSSRSATPATPSNAATPPPSFSSSSTGETFADCTAACPEMVAIPPGEFMMGSNGGNPNETPVHKVTIGYTLAVGKYEITWAQWQVCVNEGGCPAIEISDDDFGGGGGSRPLTHVSWNDAQSYVAWLSRKTGQAYRLLSEAEWEYAARGGTTSTYFWGENPDDACAYANGLDLNFTELVGGVLVKVLQCHDGRGDTATAGSYKPNPFGLYDMMGNVSEWVQDWYRPDYSGAPADGSAIHNCSRCKRRVIRGGSWASGADGLRPAARRKKGFNPSKGARFIGFRVARVMEGH